MTSKRSSQLSISAVGPLKQPGHWTTNGKPKIYDFCGVLESVARIWRLLGIFPITVEASTGIRKYELNKFYAACSFLIFVTFVSNFFYTIIIFDDYYRNYVPMTVMTILIRMIAGLGSMIFTNVWRIIHFKKLSESINKLTEQDMILEKMSNRFDYKSSARIIRSYVWTTLLIILLFMTYDLYVSFNALNTITVGWLLWMFPLLTQLMDVTILVTLVGWLGLKFRSINEKIKIVVTRANASSPKVIVTSDVCAGNLRALSRAHYNICAIGKRINSAFDCEVIINVTTAFIILSTTLYYIFYEVQREGKTNVVQIISYVQYELIHIAPIIVIVLICNWTSGQAIHAGKLIHEIRVRKMDSRLYDDVKSFSLQLHHQKLEFTASGFFPLNSTLLQTMVGTITTYLVILIQFEPKLD